MSTNKRKKKPEEKEPTHAHKCPKCRCVWRHSDACFNDEKAHKCPDCGTGPYWMQHWD